jgi:hypothetical protein
LPFSEDLTTTVVMPLNGCTLILTTYGSAFLFVETRTPSWKTLSITSPSGSDELRSTNVNVAFGEKTNGVWLQGDSGAGMQISDDSGALPGDDGALGISSIAVTRPGRLAGRLGAQMLVESGFPGPRMGFVWSVGLDVLVQGVSA